MQTNGSRAVVMSSYTGLPGNKVTAGWVNLGCSWPFVLASLFPASELTEPVSWNAAATLAKQLCLLGPGLLSHLCFLVHIVHTVLS